MLPHAVSLIVFLVPQLLICQAIDYNCSTMPLSQNSSTDLAEIWLQFLPDTGHFFPPILVLVCCLVSEEKWKYKKEKKKEKAKRKHDTSHCHVRGLWAICLNTADHHRSLQISWNDRYCFSFLNFWSIYSIERLGLGVRSGVGLGLELELGLGLGLGSGWSVVPYINQKFANLNNICQLRWSVVIRSVQADSIQVA